MQETKTSKPEPFLKWAGGKRKLVARLAPYLKSPQSEYSYFEPFLGGGAAFFHLEPQSAFLSDVNEELIETYIAVRDEVESVIDYLSGLVYKKEDYYQIRSARPTTTAERAARFIYLNKTCFNGLYRVNLKGEFNVPFGRHKPSVEICNKTQLYAASKALSLASLRAGDFQDVLTHAQSGDVVYLDPPYTTTHSNNGFIEYNAKVFSWDDQR
ncbi:MAG: Dam family site-specific DNA-(adenine-N6)-methyltransferase, partial [Thermomicrobiales bacterium]